MRMPVRNTSRLIGESEGGVEEKAREVRAEAKRVERDYQLAPVEPTFNQHASATTGTPRRSSRSRLDSLSQFVKTRSVNAPDHPSSARYGHRRVAFGGA